MPLSFSCSSNVKFVVVLKDVSKYENKIYLKKTGSHITGTGQVLQNFFINEGRKKFPVAGSVCLSGEFNKKSLFRIKRADEVIYDGEHLNLLKQQNKYVSFKQLIICFYIVA